MDRLDSKKLPQTKNFDGVLEPTIVLDYIYGDLNNPYKFTEVHEKELGTNGVYNTVKTRISQYSYFSNGDLKEENIDISKEDGSTNEHSIT